MQPDRITLVPKEVKNPSQKNLKKHLGFFSKQELILVKQKKSRTELLKKNADPQMDTKSIGQE